MADWALYLAVALGGAGAIWIQWTSGGM